MWGRARAVTSSRPPFFPPRQKGSRFPPCFLTVSDSEYLYDDSVRFSEKLKAAGVPCELEVYHDLMHAFPIIAALPEAQDANKKMGQFFDRYLKEANQ